MIVTVQVLRLEALVTSASKQKHFAVSLTMNNII